MGGAGITSGAVNAPAWAGTDPCGSLRGSDAFLGESEIRSGRKSCWGNKFNIWRLLLITYSCLSSPRRQAGVCYQQNSSRVIESSRLIRKRIAAFVPLLDTIIVGVLHEVMINQIVPDDPVLKMCHHSLWATPTAP